MIALLLALTVATTPSGVPVSGVASWYDATRNGQSSWYTRKGITLYAAVASWRWGDKPYMLRLCREDDQARCVVVLVVDWCGRCAKDLGGSKWNRKSRAIDISPHAMRMLAPLSQGVVRVTARQILQPGR
jgi:hypothetical protein